MPSPRAVAASLGHRLRCLPVDLCRSVATSELAKPSHRHTFARLVPLASKSINTHSALSPVWAFLVPAELPEIGRPEAQACLRQAAAAALARQLAAAGTAPSNMQLLAWLDGGAPAHTTCLWAARRALVAACLAGRPASPHSLHERCPGHAAYCCHTIAQEHVEGGGGCCDPRLRSEATPRVPYRRWC